MSSRLVNPVEISFFIIATRNYKGYARSLILSLDRHMRSRFQVHVLTDDVKDFNTIVMERNLGTVRATQIESFGWPDATLRRFELMMRIFSAVNGRIVCYLDADTLLLRDTSIEDFQECLSDSRQVAAVRHPGYYKRSLILRIANSTFLGPWETRRQSAAFVPFQKRRSYVCGGVIFGLAASFREMCEDIRRCILSDFEKGIIAKHNDESYLNAWSLRTQTNKVSPEWAYAEGYRNLKGMNPRIQVLHKPNWWTRER